MKKLTTQNLRKEKNGSGLYKIYNSKKRLLYVGRAKNNVKHHLVQHFGSDYYSGAKFGSRKNKYYAIKLMPFSRAKKAEEHVVKRVKPKGNRYLYLRGRSRRRKG